MFIGRKKELDFLNDKYNSNAGQLVVLYGRRRVGKTELLKEFCKGKTNVFFTCTETPDRQQLNAFSSRLLSTGLPAAKYISSFESWDQAFESIADIPGDSKKIVVIDEFPYMVKTNSSIPSILQKVWDETLKDKNVMIILCGSAMSFMEKEILAEKNPLYGRATGVLKVIEINFYDAIQFVPDFTNEEKIITYSILGGIPHYLKQFDSRLSLEENIKKNILTRGSVLYSEVEFLLKQELREINVYNVVIEAIALGNTKLNDIYQKTQIERTKLSAYIKNLMELGIVAREFSADESPKEQANTQRGLYFLTDNFFKFWYSFVFPNVSELEAGDTDGIWEYVVKGELNNFTSYAFERICIEYLRKKNMENQLPFHFTKIGRWWNKVSEIDIMAMDHSRKNIILGECKYKNSPLDSHDINNTMKKYSADDNTNIYYWFFSKNGFNNEAKEIAADVNAVLVDLDDLFV